MTVGNYPLSPKVGSMKEGKDIVDILTVMRRQEVTTYQCNDYLASLGTQYDGVDEVWRQRMCEWMYVVVDHCNFNRDVVAISASYLDVCLSRGNGVIDSRRKFQLAAMAALHLAMKLYDVSCIKIESMVKLSRGLFTANDVVQMEREILWALSWNVHPPSPTCFLRHYLQLFPSNTLASIKFMIAEVSRFIVEISVCVYKFVKYRPSMIAYSAMLIAMEGIDEPSLPVWQRMHFHHRIASVVKLKNNSQEVMVVSQQLRQLFEKNADLKSLMKTIDPQYQSGSSKKKDLSSLASVSTMSSHNSSPRDVSNVSVSNVSNSDVSVFSGLK